MTQEAKTTEEGAAHVARATALANELAAKCTEAMLAWGRAANAAAARPGDSALELIARSYGQRALDLAMGIARFLP